MVSQKRIIKSAKKTIRIRINDMIIGSCTKYVRVNIDDQLN